MSSNKSPEMKSILFCCIILLLVSGCRKSIDNNAGNQNRTDIFPNKVGDTWVYLVNDTSYSFQNPATIVQYNMTVSIIGSVQLSGSITANVWVYNYPGGTDTNYVFQHGDTISFTSNARFYNEMVRQYIIPLRVHNSWQYSWNSIHDIIVDSQANIIVGQQHFENAFRVQGYPGRPDEIITVAEWIGDYVGIVKRYVNASGTTNPYKHLTSWSLVSYHLE